MSMPFEGSARVGIRLPAPDEPQSDDPLPIPYTRSVLMSPQTVNDRP
jgi:hypothetical protein